MSRDDELETVALRTEDVSKSKSTGVEGDVARAVDDLIRDTDLFLVEMIVRGHQGTRVIEIFIDGDLPVSVDRLAPIGRKLAFELESKIDGAFRLDVSSPGADRPMTHSRQFGKHVGRLLSIKTKSKNKFEGNLVEADSEGLVLKTKSESKRIEYTDIVEGVVKLPW